MAVIEGTRASKSQKGKGAASSFDGTALPKLNAIIDQYHERRDYRALAVIASQLKALKSGLSPKDPPQRVAEILQEHYSSLADWKDRDGFSMTVVLYATSGHLHELLGQAFESDADRLAALLKAVPQLIDRCGDVSRIDLDDASTFPPPPHAMESEPKPVAMAMASGAADPAPFWHDKIKKPIEGQIALLKRGNERKALKEVNNLFAHLADNFDPNDIFGSWQATTDAVSTSRMNQPITFAIGMFFNIKHRDAAEISAFQADIPELRDLAVLPVSLHNRWEEKFKGECLKVIDAYQRSGAFSRLIQIKLTLQQLEKDLDPQTATADRINRVLSALSAFPMAHDERFDFVLGTYVMIADHAAESFSHMVLDLPTLIQRTKYSDRIKDKIESWIGRFGPVLYLHPEEAYLPTSVDWFADRSSIGGLKNIPTGAATSGLNISLNSDNDRGGDFSQAKAYVHVKAGPDNTTDLQFWYFYAYNGPGTARVKSLINLIFGDQTLHAGNPSLAPLGEHEGDWEHMTLRIDNASEQILKVWCSQHADGTWYGPGDFDHQNEQIIAYASKNGHACYNQPSSNYTNHIKTPTPAFKLEFFLRNDTARGKSMDCGKRYEIIASDLPGLEVEATPWTKYLGRWGRENGAKITNDMVADVLKAALGPVLGTIASITPLVLIASTIAGQFKVEDQNGPQAPSAKGCWSGNEED